jgi:hypothetical protein
MMREFSHGVYFVLSKWSDVGCFIILWSQQKQLILLSQQKQVSKLQATQRRSMPLIPPFQVNALIRGSSICHWNHKTCIYQFYKSATIRSGRQSSRNTASILSPSKNHLKAGDILASPRLPCFCVSPGLITLLAQIRIVVLQMSGRIANLREQRYTKWWFCHRWC